VSRRAVLAALAAAALLAASPVAGAMTSLALFTDTASATGNTVTGGSCASTTTFTSAVAELATSGNREVWQRMTEQGGGPADDAFQGRRWTDSGAVFGTDGALYCSDDTALTLDGAADTASSDAQSYSTWGANGTVTVFLWIRGESTAAGRLVSLAEGASGGSTYAERVIWLTATGQIAVGSRYGSGSSSSFVTTTSGVDVVDGRWHLIAVVMPNTATTNPAPTILVDGSAASATTTGTVTYRARSSSGTSARWYLGDNNAGRLPTGAPSTAWIGDYDEFVVVAGTPTATQLGSGAGSLYRAADS
jgi:hypothetical protein